MSKRRPLPSHPSPRPATRSRLRFVAAPFFRLRRWFGYQPLALRVGLVAVLVAGVTVGGVYARSVLKKRETAREVAAAWGAFREAQLKADADAMRAALDRVQAAAPDDAAAARVRSVLDRGEADPDTPDLALFLLKSHLRAGRLPEAAREAEKVLAKVPGHWQARCTTALYALAIQRDPARAEQLLDLLPDPEDPGAHVGLGEVLYALSLFDAVGRDSAPLRRMIVRRVAPLTRSGAAANATPAEKSQLVACYLTPFADPGSLGELAPFWAAADKLAEDAVSEAAAAGDLAVLTRMGQLGPRMRGALVVLRRHDPTRLPDERFAPLLRAIDDRTRRAWQSVRDKAPDQSPAYLGLAQLALAGGDVAAAVRELLDGLRACGERSELLAALLEIADRTATPEAVQPLAESLRESAEATKTDPVKWRLAATAQVMIGRADLALDACAKARTLQPDHPWAYATEAHLRARAGDFPKAREALAPLGDAVRTSPELARLHACVLVGAGQWAACDEEFRKLLDAQARAKPKTFAPAVAFLAGVLDAPPDAERAAWVAGKADQVLSEDSAAPLAARVRAEAHFRLADLSAAPHPKGEGRPPVWDFSRVTAALRAHAALPVSERVEADVIAAVAVLHLKGEGNAGAALRAAEPLLPLEAELGPRHLEALGAALAANGRPAEAVRVLSRAAKMPRPSVGCLVALALAYHANSQPAEARAALAAAASAPDRTGREQAELVAAKLLFQREMP